MTYGLGAQSGDSPGDSCTRDRFSLGVYDHLELPGELPATSRPTVAYQRSSGSERSVGETGTPFAAVSAAEHPETSCSP